jgi:hypothetical protein
MISSNMYKCNRCFITGLFALCSILVTAFAQNSVPNQLPQMVRLRGTIVQADLHSMLFRERGGELISISLDQQLIIQEVYPIEIEKIEQNSFIGTAALADKNGHLVALEVHVFPESIRGTGEGHRAWDSVPGSTMTNASVDELIRVGKSRELHLKYKGGEKNVLVPDNVPIVTYRPGDAGLLVPGANAVVMATDRDGKPTASRIMVGRDGFKPPM